jgi:hypothetical protein
MSMPPALSKGELRKQQRKRGTFLNRSASLPKLQALHTLLSSHVWSGPIAYFSVAQYDMSRAQSTLPC